MKTVAVECGAVAVVVVALWWFAGFVFELARASWENRAPSSPPPPAPSWLEHNGEFYPFTDMGEALDIQNYLAWVDGLPEDGQGVAA